MDAFHVFSIVQMVPNSAKHYVFFTNFYATFTDNNNNFVKLFHTEVIKLNFTEPNSQVSAGYWLELRIKLACNT